MPHRSGVVVAQGPPKPLSGVRFLPPVLMATPTLIPLSADGKVPSVRGWATPDFVPPADHRGGWALRTDSIIVIDADSPAAAARFEAEAGPTPYKVRTRKGYHLYYRGQEGIRPTPLNDLADGSYCKTGRGAYVVAPGTVVKGHRYEWVGEPWDWDPASLPPAPAETIARYAPSRKELSADEGWDVIPDGMRNSTLTAIAGSLRRQGAGVEAIGAVVATLNANRCSPPLDADELLSIVRSVVRYEANPDEADGDVILLSDDEDEDDEEDGAPALILWAKGLQVPAPPTWLQYPFLPEGRLVLVDGNEGIGKGMFATWVATNLAAGRLNAAACPVLWGSTEDDPAEDILRRLLAAGYLENEHQGIGFLTGKAMAWRFPNDLGHLYHSLVDTKAKALILDPGRSFLGAPGQMSAGEFSYNSEAHLRPGLEGLNQLARKLGVTVIFIHHWNKNLTASIRVRSGGSAAFAQVVRHRVTLDYMNGFHAIAVEKSNMAARENTVHSYSLEPVEEWQTARFVLGENLPVVDLDAWEEEQRATTGKMSKGEESGLQSGIVYDAALGELPAGQQFWTDSDLKERFGLGKDLARGVTKELQGSGHVSKGARGANIWTPQEG